MKKSTTILIILFIGVLFILLGAKCPWEKDKKETGSSGSAPTDPVIPGTWAWDGTDWQLLHPSNEPQRRSYHAMVYDSARQRIVLFGGGDGYGKLNDIWEWDGANWLQHYSTVTPTVRMEHMMAYDSGRGVTVLFGGYGSGQMNDTWEWDGTNWTQRFPINSPSVRDSSGMAYDQARGKTILFGGSHSPTSTPNLKDTWEWDGTNWTQLFPATAPPGRNHFAMGYDSARQRIVLFGGYGASNDTWEWDGTNWTEVIPAGASSYNNPSSRPIPQGMAYDPVRQRTVLYGGVERDTFYPYCLVWEWDGVSWVGKTAITRPGERSWANAMAYDGINKKVLIFW